MSLVARAARFALKRPRAAIALAALGVTLTTAGAIALRSGTCAVREASLEPAAPTPRAILNRFWFDAYPEGRTTTTKGLIFFSSGIGLYEEGSSYKWGIELFEFERNGDKLEMVFLQDKAKHATGFRVEACSDNPPFDACLILDKGPRGLTKYYGFLDDEEFAERVPWGPARKQAAEKAAASASK